MFRDLGMQSIVGECKAASLEMFRREKKITYDFAIYFFANSRHFMLSNDKMNQN
jgi:hypothetical protein